MKLWECSECGCVVGKRAYAGKDDGSYMINCPICRMIMLAFKLT